MFEPLSPFAVFVHCALLALILAVEVYRNRKRRFDYLTLFSAAYLLNYAVVPLVYDVIGYSGFASATRGLKQPPAFELDEAAVDILLGYGAFIGGYFLGRDCVTPSKSPIVTSRRAARVGFALGVVGAIAFFLYALAYGGVLGLIKVAPLLRAGKKIAATALVSSSKFMGMTAFGLWAAASAVFERRSFLRIGLLAAFCAVAMLAAMATAGRTPMLVYFVPVLLLAASKGEAKIPILAGVLMLLGLVLWVDWAKTIAYELGGIHVNWELHGGITGKFLEDFYPTYASVPAALKEYDVTGQLYGLSDFGTALEHLLPQHLLGIQLLIQSSGNLNTSLVGLSAGTAPPGLIAWSIYSLGPGGFLLWPLLYGTLAGVLQSRYAPDQTRNPFAFCVYMGIGAFSSYSAVFDADPTIYLNTLVWLIGGVAFTEIFVRAGERGSRHRSFVTPPIRGESEKRLSTP